jgi:hypothetical protein
MASQRFAAARRTVAADAELSRRRGKNRDVYFAAGRASSVANSAIQNREFLVKRRKNVRF